VDVLRAFLYLNCPVSISKPQSAASAPLPVYKPGLVYPARYNAGKRNWHDKGMDKQPPIHKSAFYTVLAVKGHTGKCNSSSGE
jgi:hypothetical protein